MERCCDAEPCEDDARASRGNAASCPGCGAVGRPVANATLEAILPREAALGLLVIERRFCGSRDCDILYYGADGRSVHKRQALVRVGAKEAEDPIPVCYCFGFTRDQIRAEILATGGSSILQRVKEAIRAGECRCERANPSGGCCLGELSAVAKGARALLGAETGGACSGDAGRKSCRGR
ncbi:MAG: (2Fe-2S)-binding protein [Deltaproteobacteria bacterium]|nr:(2Fe-2S)-binding protein [Deltaproteobacteria bacterium]